MAANQEGFRSVLEMWPAYLFHALFSIAGLQLIRAGSGTVAATVTAEAE